jgi:hypothetical protein
MSARYYEELIFTEVEREKTKRFTILREVESSSTIISGGMY